MTHVDWTRKGFVGKEPVLWRCPECENGLLLAPAEARTRKFCSRKCAASAQRAGTHPLPPGHSSDEGKKKSLENLSHDGSNAAALWKERLISWPLCTECGEPFPTRATTPPLYCSASCRSKAMSRQRHYTDEHCCCVCSKMFRTSRYRPARTCSRSCASTMRHREKKERRAASGQQEEAVP